MDKTLNIKVIQTCLKWENHEVNRNLFEKKFRGITADTDLIVLPEMFTTGFSMKSEALYETMEGTTIKWMKKWAAKLGCALTGSLIIKENNKFFNRCIFAYPNETILHYDKRHLFRMAKENDHFTEGNKKQVVELNGWKICLQICYDLRFPVWSRNINEEYDCLIYMANWPKPRNTAWKTLLRARAMENQAFVIGVNRVGKDGMGINYSGDSAIISPKGDILSSTTPNEESILATQIHYKDLKEFREKFPVSLDADNFQLIY